MRLTTLFQEAVDNLMDLLTDAINESEELEGRLNQYDDMLEHIRDSMEKMAGKTKSLSSVNEKNKKLLVGGQTIPVLRDTTTRWLWPKPTLGISTLWQRQQRQQCPCR